MTSLRESKKQATRQAIADSAARILLTGGPDDLTVSRVAEKAGISTRTFHNYFSDLYEALAAYAESAIAKVAEDVTALPADYGAVDAAESLFSEAVEHCNVHLHSLSALMLVMDKVKGMGPPPQSARQDPHRMVQPLVDAFAHRQPSLSPVEARLQFVACGAVGTAALAEFYRLPEPRDPEEGRELVRTAFAVLRTTN